MRLRRMRDGDAGVSLLEMLVSTMIVMVVLSVTLGSVITVWRSQKVANERSLSASSNRVGFELLTKLLRQATYPAQGSVTNSTIITVAGPQRIQFTSRLGSTAGAVPMRYEFELVGTNLMWGSTPANCVDAALCDYDPPNLTKTAVSYVRNAVGGGPCPGAPTDGAIFTYYSASAANGGALTAFPIAADDTLSGELLGDVASVGIALYTDAIPGKPLPGCESITGLTVLRNKVHA
jgi:hypothetical protein